MHKFERKDSWILLSVAQARHDGPPKLDNVIWVADGINKDIPTREEIEGAINRLLSAGLVRVAGYYFFVTELGSNILEQARSGAKSIFDVWNMLEKRLGTTEFPEVPHAPWHLSESDFERAYESYRSNFAKTFKKLDDKDELT